MFDIDNWPWEQFALLAALMVWAMAAGLKERGRNLDRPAWKEIIEAVALVLLGFAFVTEGKGCQYADTTDYYEKVCPPNTPGC